MRQLSNKSCSASGEIHCQYYRNIVLEELLEPLEYANEQKGKKESFERKKNTMN